MTQPEQKTPDATTQPVPPRYDDAPCELHELGAAEMLAVPGGPMIQNDF